MASTYSPLLRFELIGSGDQSGLWGTTTNGNLGSLVEQAVAGVASIVLSSAADYTLQTLNGTPDESRCAVLSFSGAPGGATNIIIPASQKLYVVRNSTGQTLTIKTAAQVGGVTVLDANATLVFCNGINALAGIQSSSTANVTGPASSTANAIARFNGTTGQLLKNSVGATIDDTGAPTFTGIIQANPVSASVGASIRLLEGSSGGTNFVSFKAPNTLSADVTWTLPNADATVAGQVLSSNASGTLSWITSGSGTVTSVSGSGGSTGLSLTGGPITTSGTLTLGGTLAVASGGTGASSLASAGIPTTSASSTFSGNNTFTGGAAFGNTTSTGSSQALVVKPNGTNPVSFVGLLTQNNSTCPGAVMRTDSTGTSLVSYNFAGTEVGFITTNGSTCSLNNFSDYRLKENVAPLTGAADTVKKLLPKTFTWITNPSVGTAQGFIAHELQEVVPAAVNGNKDGLTAEGAPKYQGVDITVLIPLLTAALQEALARIEALEAKVG
jgi:hypothetical protein